jgi:hypothetical protein
MNGRATVCVVALLCGCARGTAAWLDGSGNPSEAWDGSIGSGDSNQGDDNSPGHGDGQGDGDSQGDGDDECMPDQFPCGSSSMHDAATPMHDDGVALHDAGTPSDRKDGGHSTPEVIHANYRVEQENAALQQPLVTDLQLQVGDEVRLSGGGYIWPGLIAQGCNGPDGTTGKHSSAGWPLKGGPDFALVAYVNGAWALVGTEQTFQVTQAARLQLGTNDDDNQTGDDCTSVSEDERGFSVSVQITRP